MNTHANIDKGSIEPEQDMIDSSSSISIQDGDLTVLLAENSTNKHNSKKQNVVKTKVGTINDKIEAIKSLVKSKIK